MVLLIEKSVWIMHSFFVVTSIYLHYSTTFQRTSQSTVLLPLYTVRSEGVERFLWDSTAGRREIYYE